MASRKSVVGVDNLVRSRDILKTSLEKSRDIALSLHQTSARVSDIDQRLPSLEAAIRTIACKCALFGIGDHVDRVIGPVEAVFNVYQVVHELEITFLPQKCSDDLPAYISLLKRLEQALTFLTRSCELAIMWLEGLMQFLENTTVLTNEWYHSNVKKSLRILEELQRTEERSRCKGGTLYVAFGKLENEFRNLLTENSFPLLVPSSLEEADDIIPSLPAIPPPVIQKLQAIIKCFAMNQRVDDCINAYVYVRSLIVQKTLQGLELDYLKITLPEYDSMQGIRDHIDKWGRHLEFVLKHVVELEYRLCNDVFSQNIEQDIWMECFAKIAAQSGIQDFINFGNMVAKSKKEALKLFKLLDVFATLNKLRLDFNRVFGGKSCCEIQSQTRNLVKNIVNGACEIFWELSAQVELQRLKDPPSDGSVPRLVSFVMDYLNELLDDDYAPILNQVLEINWSWNEGENFQDGLLSVEVHNIIRELELNLETWARRYEDRALAYFFRMNNHWYLCKNLKDTQLGNLMGESWLKGHEEHLEYYAALYLKESWGKLPALLSEEGMILFSGGRETVQDLVKKRIKGFKEAFDEMYRKQSDWVLCDRGLRRKTCQLLVEVTVPVYRSYMRNYSSLVEEGGSPNKYVKYSAESLENMLNSLFQTKLGKYANSAKSSHLIGKIKNVVSNHFSSTPVAA